MKVVITREAYADLLEIGQAIKADNPQRAETFLAELYDRCEKLGAAPKAYPLVVNWEERGIRRRSHGNYLIFYRINEDTIEVLHGARDYEAILFQDE